MPFESFLGNDPRHVLDDARRAMGDDVLIVRSRIERRGARTNVELIAIRPRDLQELTRRLNPPSPHLPSDTGGRGRSGPFVLALVGPTGGGKSSALVKLALNRRAFGNAKIGILTLDTFRVAALEHLQQYADIGGLMLEAIYDEREVVGAMERLDCCDVVIVDTPGRSPRATEANTQWQALLAAVAPDETHLVLPAMLRPEAVEAAIAQFASTQPTHLILSKTDELPDETMLCDVFALTNLSLRWITTGQSVPDDLRPARTSILAALGLNRQATPRSEVAA